MQTRLMVALILRDMLGVVTSAGFNVSLPASSASFFSFLGQSF